MPQLQFTVEIIPLFFSHHAYRDKSKLIFVTDTFWQTFYKADISIQRTLFRCPNGVRFREIPLYFPLLTNSRIFQLVNFLQEVCTQQTIYEKQMFFSKCVCFDNHYVNDFQPRLFKKKFPPPVNMLAGEKVNFSAIQQSNFFLQIFLTMNFI